MKQQSITQQNYLKAPIIEAVIDLRVLPAKDLNFSKLELAVREKFIKEYPNISKQFHNEFRFESRDNPQTNPIISHPGLRFTSEDGKQILQKLAN